MSQGPECYIVRYCLTAAALVTDSLARCREHSGVCVSMCVCVRLHVFHFYFRFDFLSLTTVSSLTHFTISPFFFSTFIVIYVLVRQLDNSLSAFLPVRSSPLSTARYKITLKYCPVFMSLGSRLPAPIYCWDGSRGCVQWVEKKKRKALILNWGCFPHLSTEGH